MPDLKTIRIPFVSPICLASCLNKIYMYNINSNKYTEFKTSAHNGDTVHNYDDMFDYYGKKIKNESKLHYVEFVKKFVNIYLLNDSDNFFYFNCSMQDDARKILRCLALGKESNQYDNEVRSFAITSHMYRPRLYNYMRKKFNNNLPHESTVKNWYSNCHFDGSTGITSESLDALKVLVAEMKRQNKTLYCSLSFDEMRIRRVVQWLDYQKKFSGYVTYGRKNDNGSSPVASQALVFVLSGINVSISIPVAYHFITYYNIDSR